MSAPAAPLTTRMVDSSDGVRIASYEQGAPDGPVLVLVHGFPDSHRVWDAMVPILIGDPAGFRVIRFDNRGVGASSVPAEVSAYRVSRLADDLAAVIDALSPGQPVHIVGHDWGSVATWEYLTRPGAQDRIASFTSVSGPPAGAYAASIRAGLAQPYRLRRFAGAVSRRLRLSYQLPFAAPVLGPAAARVLFSGRGADGVADAVRSLKIYRALRLPREESGPREREVSVPVQLVVNLDDPYIRPDGFELVPSFVPRLWRRDINAGHWSPVTHPQVLARAVSQFAGFVGGGPADRELLRAQVGRPRKYFGDTLVSVTGAGSGIGRQTAYAFAREGAELVVSDIDEASLKETAAQIAAAGGLAHAYVLDVSDAAAVEQFADEVCAAHGVPDIVVNNAGIGQAGRFLDTPADQWDRVLEVNLGGVVNGCRAFAGRLVERGTGGHIVNVASMASYAPLQSLNAYCTSKAAVYMFSDCLRAELDSAGIGLTTVCPSTVDTNIVRTTRFNAPAGKSQEVAGRRGQLEKIFALRRYGPDKAAAAIVSAVKHNKPIRPVMPEAYFVYGVSRLLPQALRSTARGRVL